MIAFQKTPGEIIYYPEEMTANVRPVEWPILERAGLSPSSSRTVASTVLAENWLGCEHPMAVMPLDILTKLFIFSRIKFYYFCAGFSFSDIEKGMMCHGAV